VRLKVDEANGGPEQAVTGLEAGKVREVKFENVRLNKGEHTLTAVADAKDAVDESDEENNDRDVTARCKDAS
jgi:subtilase family serine protease